MGHQDPRSQTSDNFSLAVLHQSKVQGSSTCSDHLHLVNVRAEWIQNCISKEEPIEVSQQQTASHLDSGFHSSRSICQHIEGFQAKTDVTVSQRVESPRPDSLKTLLHRVATPCWGLTHQISSISQVTF